MDFLFVTDRVENPAGVDVALAYRTVEALRQQGHDADILELWDGTSPLPDAPAGCTRTLLPFPDERLMNEILEYGAKGGTPVPKRLAKLACHPLAARAAVLQLALHRPRRTTVTKKRIERLCAAKAYDAVVCVCAPYRTAFALEKARITAKKLLWQMDPYAGQSGYTAPGGFAREKQLIDAMHRVYIAPTALRDYAEGAPLYEVRGKMRVLGFPALVPMPDPAPHEGLRCTFCGSLYPGLREPNFALALFAALNDPELTLTMAGRGWKSFSAATKAAGQILGSRLVLPGPLPPAEAAALEQDADVLLNLGNTRDEQMPSKIFAFLGSGKPILHLAASDTDPTLPYLARYPLALVLYAKDGVTPGVTARLNRWLHEVRGRQLPFAETAQLYPEFTPEKVAEEFLRWI